MGVRFGAGGVFHRVGIRDGIKQVRTGGNGVSRPHVKSAGHTRPDLMTILPLLLRAAVFVGVHAALVASILVLLWKRLPPL